MKRFIRNWMGAALAIGVICSLSTPSAAQTNDLEQTIARSPSDDTNTLAATTNASEATAEQNWSERRRGPVVSLGSSATLAAGESAETVVAIGGSAKASGKVQDAVIAIGGDAEAESDVGDAVVAIGGEATARGNVGDAVVAIAGNAEAHGEVGDAVVAVMGDVKIGPGAVVRGDVVSVGGKIEIAEDAQIKGEIIEVSVAQYPILVPLHGVADWLRHCVLKFRLLAPQPGWYWVVAIVFLVLYLLIAAATPRPVAACVTELTQRPATTFLLGLLMKLLLPLVFIILAITGIGMVVVPFILAAVFIAGLIGKVALLQYLGEKLLRVFGVAVARPILALLAGFAVITLLYMVPLLSLLIYTLIGTWALGAAVTATFSGVRKESAPRPPYNPTMTSPPGAPPNSGSGFQAPPVTNFTTAQPAGDTTANPPGVSTAQSSSPVPEAYALPRAGFWERMSAAFLDVIIVAILSAFVGGLPLGFLVALAYFAGMWTWKGTTIGGIVLNLKVVRLDAQPVTFAVALVRGLASALSAIVFFVGFLWIVMDRDKQTWHDKIAGTVVVRSPRAMSLVCL